MADSSAYADTRHDAPGGSVPGSAPRTPRWVKVSGILALIAVLALVVMLLAGGGQHGPGRHAPGGSGGQQQRQPAGEMPDGTIEGQMPAGSRAGGHPAHPGGEH